MTMSWQPAVVLTQRADGDEENQGPFNIRVTTVLLLAAMLFVSLRFLARYVKSIQYGAEDWTCLLALVSHKPGGNDGEESRIWN